MYDFAFAMILYVKFYVVSIKSSPRRLFFTKTFLHKDFSAQSLFLQSLFCTKPFLHKAFSAQSLFCTKPFLHEDFSARRLFRKDFTNTESLRAVSLQKKTDFEFPSQIGHCSSAFEVTMQHLLTKGCSRF